MLPLLLLILFGIIEFGRYYNARIALTGAVREGARVLALGTGDPAQTTVDAAPTLDGSLISVIPSASPCTSGQPATVAASYPFAYAIPFWRDGTITIESSGVMRCGG